MPHLRHGCRRAGARSRDCPRTRRGGAVGPYRRLQVRRSSAALSPGRDLRARAGEPGNLDAVGLGRSDGGGSGAARSTRSPPRSWPPTRLHVDDTPVPVLAPGTGKTKTGRLWTYVRDERPFAGKRPAGGAVLLLARSQRRAPASASERLPRRDPCRWRSRPFNELFAGGKIVEAACWAHVRRKFFDVHAATGSPIAKEALDRIGQLYRVEETINGAAPDHRRRERRQQSMPIAEALRAWAEETVRKLSRKSELAAAFRYMRARWTALTRCFDDGRLALDNNPAERALRCVAIGRKNYLFAGSDTGGRRAAAMYSLIESGETQRPRPEAYLRDLLGRIADHPARRIAELLPWNWQPIDATRAAA